MTGNRNQKVVDGLGSILRETYLSAITAYAKEIDHNSSIEIKNGQVIFCGIEFVSSHPHHLLDSIPKKNVCMLSISNQFKQLFMEHKLESIIQRDPRREMKIFMDDTGVSLRNVYLFYKTEGSK